MGLLHGNVPNARQLMDNKYDWETIKAVKEDYRYIKDILNCILKGHDYIPDECGYACQKCYWLLSTNLEFDSWQEYYDLRPSKWTWRG